LLKAILKPRRIFVGLLLSSLSLGTPLWAQTTVFLRPADALKLIFKDSQEVHKRDFAITPEIQKKAKGLLGYELPKSHYSFYIGKSQGKVDGYALIDEQVGKVLPITFVTRISPEGAITAVEIMVYRESRGGEVQSKRFLKQFNPKLVILMERELWPNLLRFCKKYDITVLLANGRLPDRSAQRYAKVKNFTEKMLSAISCFAVTSENAIKNFLHLGVPTEKIELCGNVKFDAKINQDLVDKGISFRQEHCANRPVWIAASTHEGEEEIALTAHALIREQFPMALLVLVPRHPERFDSVFNLCKNQDYNVARRSKNEVPTDKNDIFLGDTMGEMFFYYSVADVSFVAGSIKPIGGHNLLEPASVGKPVITGKQLFNFKEGEALFKAADAMIQVENANDLSAAVISLFEDENKLKALSQRGLDVVNSNKGAVEKHLSLIAELI